MPQVHHFTRCEDNIHVPRLDRQYPKNVARDHLDGGLFSTRSQPSRRGPTATTFVVQFVLKMWQETTIHVVSFHEVQSPRFADDRQGEFCYSKDEQEAETMDRSTIPTTADPPEAVVARSTQRQLISDKGD